MPRVTFAIANHELATKWAAGFFKRYVVPKSIIRPLYRTLLLYKQLDFRRLFKKTAKISKFITGVGHGSPTEYTGQYQNVLWAVGEYNPTEVKGKIIKLLSCSTGKSLGPDLIINGAKAYQGYDSIFAFMADTDRLIYHIFPWLDPTAKKFLLPPMKGIKALLEGKTNKEAYEIEYAEFTKNIEREEDPEIAAILMHDRDHLVMLGDPNAKLKIF